MNTLILTLFLMVVTAVDGAEEYNIDRRFGKTSRFLSDAHYNIGNVEVVPKFSLIKENVSNSKKKYETYALDVSENNKEDQIRKYQFHTKKIDTVNSTKNSLSEMNSSLEQSVWNSLHYIKTIAIANNNSILLDLLNKIIRKRDLKVLVNAQKSLKVNFNDILLYTGRKHLENLVKRNKSISEQILDQKLRKTVKDSQQLISQEQHLKRGVLYSSPTLKKDKYISTSFLHNNHNSTFLHKDKFEITEKSFIKKFLESNIFNTNGIKNAQHLTKDARKVNLPVAFNEKYFIDSLSSLRLKDLRTFTEILTNKSDFKSTLSAPKVQYVKKHSIEKRNNLNPPSAFQLKIENILANLQEKYVKKREVKHHKNDLGTKTYNSNKNNNISTKSIARKSDTKKISRGPIGDLITSATAKLIAAAIRSFLKTFAPTIVGNIYSILDKEGVLGDFALLNILNTIGIAISGIITAIVVSIASTGLRIFSFAIEEVFTNVIDAETIVKYYKKAIELYDEQIGILHTFKLIVKLIKKLL